MTGVTSTEVRDAIAAANEEFMAAFNRGDAAGLAALYTDHGQVLPPNSDFVTGKPAIQTFWQAVMDTGVKEAELETIEVEGHGDTATEVSKFTLKGEGGQVLDQGKYIIIWKQEDGGGSCTGTSLTAVWPRQGSDALCTDCSDEGASPAPDRA